MKNFKTKKPTLEDVAKYIGKSYSAVRKRSKEERRLLQLGLWVLQEQKPPQSNGSDEQ